MGGRGGEERKGASIHVLDDRTLVSAVIQHGSYTRIVKSMHPAGILRVLRVTLCAIDFSLG